MTILVVVCVFVIIIFLPSSTSTVDDLVKQWAPLVWLAPQEKYMPSNVEDFLSNVYVANEDGKGIMPYFDKNISLYKTKRFNLMTYRTLDNLKQDPSSFIYGKNPAKNPVSIYALVTKCGSTRKSENEIKENVENSYFHVSYWIFYPYNEGKDVCTIGGVPTFFKNCPGRLRTLGNHLGDWEHMSLYFSGKNIPDSLFLAVHDVGAYYTYNEENKYFKFDFPEKRKPVAQLPKFPEILRLQGEHPIVFSAKGSHGMWSTNGENEYNKIPKLTDKSGYGIPWKTWKNVKIFHLGKDSLPPWMNFRGKWGNPKQNCFLSKKLGICEYSDGPEGIIRQRQDFYCQNR